MNESVNMFLLAGDKFMPEMHLKQPGFTYSVCGPFTKNKERNKKFIQTGNTDFNYRNELDKACFQHDIVFGLSKDLVKELNQTKSEEIQHLKLHIIQIWWLSKRISISVYKVFDKKSSGSGIASGPNNQLANELHKLIIREFKKRKVYSSFKDNIWGVDLADM